MNEMRAAQYDAYGPPEVLRVRTVAVPSLRPGHVLVRVAASSLNGADIAVRSGKLKLVTSRKGQACWAPVRRRGRGKALSAPRHRPDGVRPDLAGEPPRAVSGGPRLAMGIDIGAACARGRRRAGTPATRVCGVPGATALSSGTGCAQRRGWER